MKSEDFNQSNQLFSLENINHDLTQVVSEQVSCEVSCDINLKFGIFQSLSEIDPILGQFLTNIEYSLQLYLKTKVYNADARVCPTCQGQNIRFHNTYTKSIKDIFGIVEVEIQRYWCKMCEQSFSLDDAFTFSDCHISKPLSRLMVILYTGGCSLRYTTDIIKSTTNVSISHEAVREHILKWGYKIREDFSKDVTRKSVKSAQIDEQYFTIRTRDPRNRSIQVIVLLDPNNNRIVDIKVNHAKQITELDALMIIGKSKPDKIITDGALAYETAAEETGTEQIRCLQHKLRNIRKKKKNKEQVTRIADEIIENEYKRNQLVFKKYKRKVIEELTELLKEKKIVKKTGLTEIDEVNKMRDEYLKNKYSGENGKTLQQIYQAYVRRIENCANEMAERVNLMKLRKYSFENALKEELTTGKLEGFNRLSRNRERKALCFRTIKTVEALAYLNAEFFNYRRGHGIPDTAFSNFNQINIEKIGSNQRELTIRTKKYNQQFTHQIKNSQITPMIQV